MDASEIKNAEAFDVVHSDAWQFFKNYLNSEMDALNDMKSLQIDKNTSNFNDIGRQAIARVGAISIIESVIDDIETRAEQHQQALDALQDNPDRIVHRHNEDT